MELHSVARIHIDSIIKVDIDSENILGFGEVDIDADIINLN